MVMIYGNSIHNSVSFPHFLHTMRQGLYNTVGKVSSRFRGLFFLFNCLLIGVTPRNFYFRLSNVHLVVVCISHIFCILLDSIILTTSPVFVYHQYTPTQSMLVSWFVYNIFTSPFNSMKLSSRLVNQYYCIRVGPRFGFLLINSRFNSSDLMALLLFRYIGFNGIVFFLVIPQFYLHHHCRLLLFLPKFVLLFQFLDFPSFRFTKILFYFLLRNTVCFLTAVRFFFHIFVIYFFGKFNFFSNGSLFFTFFPTSTPPY